MNRKEKKFIPNRLRKYRLMMGYKQKDVARLLGIKSQSKISRWEKGLSTPSLKNLFQLSALYKTLCDALYFDFFKETREEVYQKIYKQK